MKKYVPLFEDFTDKFLKEPGYESSGSFKKSSSETVLIDKEEYAVIETNGGYAYRIEFKDSKGSKCCDFYIDFSKKGKFSISVQPHAFLYIYKRLFDDGFKGFAPLADVIYYYYHNVDDEIDVSTRGFLEDVGDCFAKLRKNNEKEEYSLKEENKLF